ncbi:MAG: hypothetical protein FWF03_06695, partial [Defluviitaleaceae bacterium]|nr:hypothetical protein [Defluviitaleaceae bacterium]
INRYKKFRLPIHFTELTVLSGRSASGINWHGTAEDNAWSVEEEDYARQAEYVERFYRQLFASPEVEAIIWWDFPDGNWLGAPAGLVTKDLRPKTAYEALKKLIKGEWATNQEGAADANGEYKLRAFFGSYEIGVRVPGSKELVVELDINKNGRTNEQQDIYIRL